MGRGPRRRPRCVRLRRDDGFTLIETLVAIVVLVTGLVGLLGLLDSSVKASAATHQREAATNLARQILEDARGIPYPQISPSSIIPQLQALPGLANEGSGSSWQLVRSHTTYTITLKECSIDDGKGGQWGVHKITVGGVVQNPFCGDAGEKEFEGTAGEVQDPQPEDLKRITVDVTWTAIGRSPDVRQVETLSAAGAAPGLSATNLELEAPPPEVGSAKTKPVIISSAVGSLKFAVYSPTGTAAMRWSLEGVAQPTAPTLKEGNTWTFSWAIPDTGEGAVGDGTYTVGVQAIDKLGVLGPPVSIPVTLIRNIPAAPSVLKGGFNTINMAGTPTKVAELQWQGSTERSVIGYRVKGPEGLTCPGSLATLSTATSCIDFGKSPEKYTASTYSVAALYRGAEGEVKEGAAATLSIPAGAPTAPNAPTALKIERNPEGIVELHWTPPSGGEPVIFYRVYRGAAGAAAGSTPDYTSRYDVAPGTATSYIDNNASEPHSYWLTAVDASLTESSFLGPETL
jgi:prepilin-type N-terminal cleavage/methylation domain-containing protein